MITTVEDALMHMQSGNARFVLHSLGTNNSYQYLMKENRTGKRFDVFLISKANELAYLGAINNGNFERGKHTRVHANAPAYQAFVWVWKKLSAYQFPNGVEITAIE